MTLVVAACNDADTFNRGDGPLEGSLTETLERPWITDGSAPEWRISGEVLGFEEAGDPPALRRAYVQNGSPAIAVEWVWANDGPDAWLSSALVHTDPDGEVDSGLRAAFLPAANGFAILENGEIISQIAHLMEPAADARGRIEVRGDKVRFLVDGDVVIGWTTWSHVESNSHGLIATDSGTTPDDLAKFSEFAIERLEGEDIPEIPAELTIAAPAEGSTVFDPIPVAVNYDVGGTPATVRYLVNGELVSEHALPSNAAALEVPDVESGTIEITVELVDLTGEVLVSETVTVTLDRLSDEDAWDDLVDRYGAGSITDDEFLIAGVLAASAHVHLEDIDGEVHDSATGEVLAIVLALWDEASPEAKAVIEALNEATITAVDPGGPAEVVSIGLDAGVQSGGGVVPFSAHGEAPCRQHRAHWPAGRITLNRVFCEYLVSASPANLPGGTPAVQFRWMYETTLDRTAHATYSSLPAAIIQPSLRMWQAQDLWTDHSIGFDLPAVHRTGTRGAKPITIFAMETGMPAYSSPFRVTPIGGHPIRVGSQHLARTIIHELFHTFQWNSIDDRDIAGSSTGRTVAFYESAANWGVHRYSVAHDLEWGYHADRIAPRWLSRPQIDFLHYPGLTPFLVAQEAYAYFPALEWMDQHAGPAGPVPAGPRGIIQRALLGYGGHMFGADPVDLLEDQIHSRWRFSGEEAYSRVWPRMWIALYLLTEGRDGSMFDNNEFRWAHFWGSEVNLWRNALFSSPTIQKDLFGGPRPSRLESPISLTQTGQFHWVDDVFVLPGGAAFLDFVLPDDHEGVVRLSVSPNNTSRAGKYEAFAIMYNRRHPDVCEGDDGKPRIVISDGQRAIGGSVVFDLPFDPDCRHVTLGFTHTDPNSGGFPPDSFDAYGVIQSMQEVEPEPEPEPEPEEPTDPPEPGEPGWPSLGVVVGPSAGGMTPATAPLICPVPVTETLRLSSEATGAGGFRYGALYVPAGGTVRFSVSGAILPSLYWGSGRGQYQYFARVTDPATGNLVYDNWQYSSTGIHEGRGPYEWESFGTRNYTGSFTNNTGLGRVYLLETEARRSYAGSAVRWDLDSHITTGSGSWVHPSCP